MLGLVGRERLRNERDAVEEATTLLRLRSAEIDERALARLPVQAGMPGEIRIVDRCVLEGRAQRRTGIGYAGACQEKLRSTDIGPVFVGQAQPGNERELIGDWPF